MRIPPKLKVGGHTVSVIQKEIEECGTFDDEKMVITINSKMPQSRKESTLIHEIMHAMNSTLGDGAMGHALQDSLSEQLYQVLAENKLLK